MQLWHQENVSNHEVVNDSEGIMLLVEVTEAIMTEDENRLDKYMRKVDMHLILPYSCSTSFMNTIVFHWNWVFCEFVFGEYETQNYTEVKLMRK